MKLTLIYGATATVLLGACASSAIAQTFTPVTQAMLENPDPADWLHMSRTYDQQRHSPLDQINKSNVGRLQMAWSRGLPRGRQESSPIVYDGVMYVLAPGDGVLALDATNGDLIWEHWSEHTPAVTARGKSLGIYQDMIYHSAFDGFIRALDAKTGRVRWQTKVVEDGSLTAGRDNSAGGILVADGKVISNRSCNRFSAQLRDATGRKGCFIAAHDAMTGELVGSSTPRRGGTRPAETPGVTCLRRSASLAVKTEVKCPQITEVRCPRSPIHLSSHRR